MLRFRSIVSRIVFLHVVALVCIAIVMPAALDWSLRSDVDRLHGLAMRDQASALSKRLVSRPDGSFGFDLPGGIRDQYSEAYGRYFYSILDETGRVLFESHRSGTPIFPAFDRVADTNFLQTRHDDRIISGVSLKKTFGGREVWIQVAEDLSHRDVIIDDVVADFFAHVGWITVPILLLLLVTDVVIFRRAVNPLLRASEQAAQISPKRIDVRLPEEIMPNEIRPLMTAVNQALDRLEQGFRRQREFAADAAHELRTPLAILRTRIETMADKSAAAALLHDVENMSRIVSQLLDAAELETLALDPAERADLQAICVEMAEFMAPFALAKGKSIALSSADNPVWINGNAEMLRRAIRNLVENALIHTPRGTDVEIAVRESGSVSILDRGEGVPAAKRDVIFHRFWRPDTGAPGGAGLGLSIVKRIVDAHSGSIAVENRPSGGADFTMSFPLAAPDAIPSRTASNRMRTATLPSA